MLRHNLTLTFASGEELYKQDTFWAYVNSLRNVDAMHAFLTTDMPKEVEQRLVDDNFANYVYRIPKHEIHYIYRDRHLAFREFLNAKGDEYNYVLVTDCRDVVFQADPFNWIEDWKHRFDRIQATNKSFLDRFIILTSEGFKMSESGFACVEDFEFHRDVPRTHVLSRDGRYVVNAGVMMGTPRALQDFHFLIWSLTLKSSGRITDQATLNWILRYLDDDDMYNISFPNHDNLCLTGEGVKQGSVKPQIKENLLCDPLGRPYYILHQWDRLEMKDQILAQFSD